MKQFKILILFLTISGSNICTAQAFKIIKATSQRWTGGVVGRSGTNYLVEIEAIRKSNIPDTVWIHDVSYPIDFLHKDGNCRRQIDSATKKVDYTISIGELHNDTNKQHLPAEKDTMPAPQKPARHFEGAAVISYKMRHKQRFFIIKTFTVLKPMNYI